MNTSVEQLLSQKTEMTHDIVNVDQPVIKVVIVQLGQEHFAFAGHFVQEILAPLTVTPLPNTPASLEGIINLRSHIESVIQLHTLLHLDPSTINTHSQILIAQTEQLRTGIRVDRVCDVVDIIESSLMTPPSSLPEHLAPYVSALFTRDERDIALLALDTLLADYAKGLG